MNLLDRLAPAQAAIDEAFLHACRCGRVEYTGGDSPAKEEFAKIAFALREFASSEARTTIKQEQIQFDLDRLNKRELEVIEDADTQHRTYIGAQSLCVLPIPPGEFARVKIKSTNGETNWLNANGETTEAILGLIAGEKQK